jgi:hypothetical protein
MRHRASVRLYHHGNGHGIAGTACPVADRETDAKRHINLKGRLPFTDES